MNIVTKKSFEDLKYWKLGSNRIGQPKMYVYSYLIDGLLIDTGQPLVAVEFMNELKGEQIDQVVVTHHHEDHSGNINSLKSLKTGIPIYASPLCCEIMKNPPKVSPAQHLTWGQNSAAVIEPLDLNKEIVTNNLKLEIIETPGHAADHISLLEKSRGWLFAGDIYVNDYIKIFMRPEKIEEQIKSLEKLMTLDFDVLLCSHNPKFKNGKVRIKTKLDFLNNFCGEVEHHYERGMSAKGVMSKMGMRENWRSKYLSLGALSKENMVKSAIRAISESNRQT